MKKNKTFVIASMVLSLGVIMLLGSSYSLLTGEVTSEGYSFEVANFNVEFQDNKMISLNGVPMDDNEAIVKTKEFTFVVSNKSKYDVNYKLDILENSSFLMGDVIRYTYSLNDVKDGNIYTLSDNYTVRQNKVLKPGEKDTYKLKLWLSIAADERYMNKKFSASINLLATANDYKYATSVLEKLGTNYQDGLSIVDNNYRYLDKNSLNYVWFNCQDNYHKGEDYCEKWRILGIYDNTWKNGPNSQKVLKIIRNEIYDNVAYNNEELIGNYANSYINTFANGSYYDLLNKQAKDLILEGKWYIGNTDATDYNKALYNEKTIEYYTNIGLLNVSDYLKIRDNSWLTVKDVLLLNKNGLMVNVINNGVIEDEMNKELGFMPVVYLRPDVSILSGDGSSDNPYELGIKYAMNFGKVKE